jgi:5-methylcytosine-specific restriction endonuclease McrA
MYIFLVDKDRQPLYPTQRMDMIAKWLRKGQARYLRSNKVLQVFKKFKYKTIAHVKYNIGVDPGYTNIGYSVTKVNTKTNKIVVLVTGTFIINTKDIKKLIAERKMYRNSRRKHRRQRNSRRHTKNKSGVKFRIPRWRNRLDKSKLSPTVRYLILSHVNAVTKINNRCKLDNIHIEYNKFDLHKMINPKVYGYKYQQGTKYNLTNTKQYVLDRDNYTCQSCNTTKTGTQFEVHHIIPRYNNGSDHHSNLVTLCNSCHTRIHKAGDLPKFYTSSEILLKQASVVNTGMKYVVAELTEKFNNVIITYGSITKGIRQEFNISKSHTNDAMIISLSSCNGLVYNIDQVTSNNYTTNYIKFKRHSRANIHANRDRVYTVNFNIVAYNRRTRTGESTKVSLEEFKQIHGYKHSIIVYPAIRTYNTPRYRKQFNPGDVVKTNTNKYIVLKGYSVTQRRVYEYNSRNYYTFKTVNKVLNSSGFNIYCNKII